MLRTGELLQGYGHDMLRKSFLQTLCSYNYIYRIYTPEILFFHGIGANMECRHTMFQKGCNFSLGDMRLSVSPTSSGTRSRTTPLIHSHRGSLLGASQHSPPT